MQLSYEFEVETTEPEDLVHELLEHAANLGASDLFVCAEEFETVVSVRHLGLIQKLCKLSNDLGKRCVAHVKAIAQLDVGERRKPTDGRWLIQTENGHTLDLRVSTLPTLYGEDCTFRMLERETKLLDLEQLGLHEQDHNRLFQLLNNPSGLLLVTGPTGSGKTTTLYACLQYLNNGQRKINTIEDPVEYALEGVRQSQVNSRLGVSFADLLFGVLHQSPDVIMIGEIRDPETAEIAVRAANSGHLVLATMHAPIAAGAVQTLLNLGIHPHFLASSLLGVLSQRLVRTLCPDCKTSFDLMPSPHTFEEVKQHLEPGEGKEMFGPIGCEECNQLGFTERTGVFEVMPMSSGLRELVMQRRTMHEIHEAALKSGMLEFRRAALLKVARGITSIEEIFRAIPMEYLSDD